MEFESPPDYVSRTDNPRELTDDERRRVLTLRRFAAVKLHRELTNSTLWAAVACVDALLSGSAKPFAIINQLTAAGLLDAAREVLNNQGTADGYDVALAKLRAAVAKADGVP